jgi:thymidine kinase
MRHHSGRIEVICGSMFCGKTEELIRRARRAVIAKQPVQVFKPAIDNRYHGSAVTSHVGSNLDAISISQSTQLLENLKPETTVVAIDEVQFFDNGILGIVESLAERGLRVIMAGLDMDFRGEPFGSMPRLLSIAEDVTKLHAICLVCGEEACRTQRLVNGQPAHYNDPIIMVGAQESYEARCRKHHAVPRD